MTTLEQLEIERLAWSKEVFAESTPVSSLRKLEGEIKEVELDLLAGVDPTEEYADCLMCLFDSAGRAGISVEDIIRAFSVKLKKNKARKWSKNDDNSYSHIKTTDEQPAFLPLPTVAEQNANTPKVSDPMTQKEFDGKVMPSIQSTFRFYYSKSTERLLRYSDNSYLRVGYFKGNLFTTAKSDDEIDIPLDSIYLGSGTMADVQFKGKWSDLPETV